MEETHCACGVIYDGRPLKRRSAYSEKLKDPRWQRFRLKVFERDGWACTLCGCDSETLHAHHNRYNGQPWEAAPSDVVTLCATCHERVEEVVSFAKGAAPSLRMTAVDAYCVAIRALEKSKSDDPDWAFAMRMWVEVRELSRACA